jgi:hypothetical protein
MIIFTNGFIKKSPVLALSLRKNTKKRDRKSYGISLKR